MKATQSVLSQVDVFQYLPQDALASLAKLAQRRTFRAGSVIVRQGDSSESVFVIVQGHVKVERMMRDFPQPVVLAELGRGEIVGEMGLLDGQPRSATVTAIDWTEALELSASTLATTALHHPETSRELLRMLSRRLRSTDELAVQLLRSRYSSDWVPTP